MLAAILLAVAIPFSIASAKHIRNGDLAGSDGVGTGIFWAAFYYEKMVGFPW